MSTTTLQRVRDLRLGDLVVDSEFEGRVVGLRLDDRAQVRIECLCGAGDEAQIHLVILVVDDFIDVSDEPLDTAGRIARVRVQSDQWGSSRRLQS